MDESVVRLEAGLKSPALFVQPDLLGSGVSVLRWKRRASSDPHMVAYSLSQYVLSIVLRPMTVDGWYSDEQIWSGRISENSVRITPPGPVRWLATGEYDFLLFSFSESMVEHIAGADAQVFRQSLGGQLSSHGPRIDRLYMRDDFSSNVGRQSLQALLNKERLAEHFAIGMISGIIARSIGRYIELSEAASRGGLPQLKTKRIYEYITNNIDGDITLDDLAKVAELSKSHFSHAFKVTTGITPHKYILSARILKAETMLREGQQSVLSIALDCGFKDASHFSTVFRKISGVTPQNLRSRSNLPIKNIKL